MRFKTKIGIIVIALIGCVCLISFNSKDIWDENYALLKKEVLSIDQSVDTVNLTEVTPFKWDVVHFFAPYTPEEEVYKVVGYEWDRISSTVSEGMNQIVFLNDEEVVCYVYGYPSNNGFGLSYVGSSLEVDHDLEFSINRSNGVINLNK